MNEQLIDVFVTTEYKILCFLKSKQVATPEGKRIYQSQEEISKEFGMSIVTTNNLIKTLITTGCLEKYKKRSGYLITPKGEFVIKSIASLKEYSGGVE